MNLRLVIFCVSVQQIFGVLVQLKKTSLKEAIYGCRNHDQQLAYVRNETENRLITEALSTLGISGGTFRIDKLDFEWFYTKQPLYTNWMTDDTPSNSKLKCAAILYEKGDTSSKWVKVDCNTPLPSICRKVSQKSANTLERHGRTKRSILASIGEFLKKIIDFFFGSPY